MVCGRSLVVREVTSWNRGTQLDCSRSLVPFVFHEVLMFKLLVVSGTPNKIGVPTTLVGSSGTDRL